MVHGVGSRIGRFELTEVLGAGGMGLVYRAYDSTLRRDVAIKILPPQHAGEPDRVERLAREARALAAFSHPHIAQIMSVSIGVDGKPERSAELFSISRWRDYDVMPDGSRFAVVIEEAPPEEQPLSVMVGWARAAGLR